MSEADSNFNRIDSELRQIEEYVALLQAEVERLRQALRRLVDDIEYHGHGSEMDEHLDVCRALLAEQEQER